MLSTTSIEIDARVDGEGVIVGYDWQVRVPGQREATGFRPSWKSARRQARRELKLIIQQQRREQDRALARSLSSSIHSQG